VIAGPAEDRLQEEPAHAAPPPCRVDPHAPDSPRVDPVPIEKAIRRADRVSQARNIKWRPGSVTDRVRSSQ